MSHINPNPLALQTLKNQLRQLRMNIPHANQQVALQYLQQQVVIKYVQGWLFPATLPNARLGDTGLFLSSLVRENLLSPDSVVTIHGQLFPATAVPSTTANVPPVLPEANMSSDVRHQARVDSVKSLDNNIKDEEDSNAAIHVKDNRIEVDRLPHKKPRLSPNASRLLMEKAANKLFTRKSIHRAIVPNPNGKTQAANSMKAPYAPIPETSKGAEKYHNMVLTFLEPHAWDPFAPRVPGEDGYMRAHMKTQEHCQNDDGVWRKLICFVKQETKKAKYIYIGNFEIETEGRKHKILQVEDLDPIRPESDEGKRVVRAYKQAEKCSNEQAEAFLKNPEKWKVVPIRFVEFDADLFQDIKAMERLLACSSAE